MKEFNSYNKNGYAYRKSFPGATTKDIAYYCIRTLTDDKPDVFIINCGINSLYKNDMSEVVNDIMTISEYLQTPWSK